MRRPRSSGKLWAYRKERDRNMKRDRKMPEELAKITDLEELHSREAQCQHVLEELVAARDNAQGEIDRMVQLKIDLNWRIMEVLEASFQPAQEKPKEEGQ